MNEILEEGLQLHPLQEQRDSVSDWRQIGIGIMGLADMLVKLGIIYGSQKSLELCNHIGFNMINTAIYQSALLAREYGAYPKYNKEAIINSPFYQLNTTSQVKDLVNKYGLRNSQLLTIAPTGSLSTMLGISGGIEPIYNTHFTRKTESLHSEDKYYKVYTPVVQQFMELNSIKDEKDLPDYFVTAMTLNYKDRIAMQSIWQTHIDASISSTVNVPESFTVEQVKDLYLLAWEQGLKGVTIFRDNCKRIGILTNDTPKKEEDTKETI
jgi:ribonucleoside-diphosphate reductase alpha chain